MAEGIEGVDAGRVLVDSGGGRDRGLAGAGGRARVLAVLGVDRVGPAVGRVRGMALTTTTEDGVEALVVKWSIPRAPASARTSRLPASAMRFRNMRLTVELRSLDEISGTTTGGARY
jgi:hypothetical protein